MFQRCNKTYFVFAAFLPLERYPNLDAIVNTFQRGFRGLLRLSHLL